MVEYKFFNTLTAAEKQIRSEVFMDEQGFKNEFDDLDKKSIHLVLYISGAGAACGRVFFDDEGFHIGRIAVKKQYRNRGLGAQLLLLLEHKIKTDLKPENPQIKNKIIVGAQVQAEAFYKKQGFTPYGKIYDDEGVRHIKMYKYI